MIDNMDYVRAYGRGRKDGEKAVLGMISMILDESRSGKWLDMDKYFRCSLETVLEVYNYGKEKEVNNS